MATHKTNSKSRKELENSAEELKEYVDSMTQTVQKNPLRSLLIAGGIGFILSSILRR